MDAVIRDTRDTQAAVPQAIEAERALLGGILVENNGYYEVPSLAVEDFYLDAHRRIFRAFGKLLADEIPLDIITLTEELRATRQIEAVGGVAYLASLTEELPRRLAFPSYAALIQEKSRLRRVGSLASACQSAAMEGAESSSAIIGRWESAMMRLLDGRSAEDEPLAAAYLPQVIERIEADRIKTAGLLGLSYGLGVLDEFSKGMAPGEVSVVGARSGVGKSSLMIQAAAANCRVGIPVHLFSLEMSREQIMRRLLSIVSGCYFFRLRDPRELSNYDLEKVRAAAEIIAQWPLRIHDRSEMEISQIAMLARLSIRKHGTRLVCVDYAQIAQGPGRDERTRVAGISRTLASMIKHENASLMLLSQLRKVDRESYAREPHIADLRETGQLENDAHICILLHRPWDKELGRLADTGSVIVPKQRSGETGTLEVEFDRNFVIFGRREGWV